MVVDLFQYILILNPHFHLVYKACSLPMPLCFVKEHFSTLNYLISWDFSSDLGCVCITFFLSSHYVQALRQRPCKYHILSASLEISSHSFKEALMFIHWNESLLVLKSTGTVYVLYPWFPGLAAHGLEKLAGSSSHAGLLILHFIYFFTP